MAYTCMNGRLRIEAQSYSFDDENNISKVSLAPSSFPQLISSVPLTCKESMIMESPHYLKKLNMVDIKRWKNRVVVDHCWCVSESSHDLKIPLLAVLSRLRIMENEHDEIQFRNNHVSTVHLHWNQDHDRESRIDSIDSKFTHELSILLPFIASNILVSNGLLIIGTSMGVIIYDLSVLLCYHTTTNDLKAEVPFDQLKNFRFLKSYSIDAMDMNSSYFTAVSGDRIGIWSTESLKDALQMDASSIQALWATKLNGRGKATSIKISESILALSSWDGSAFVYKRVSTSEWNRVGTDSSSLDSCWEQSALQSENEYAPTTIVLGSDTFAVSAPNSTEIRIYDMNKNSLIQTVTFGSGKEVQGMVSLRFTDSLQNERYLIAAVNDLDKMVIFTTK